MGYFQKDFMNQLITNTQWFYLVLVSRSCTSCAFTYSPLCMSWDKQEEKSWHHYPLNTYSTLSFFLILKYGPLWG